jgi:hypothetical protein
VRSRRGSGPVPAAPRVRRAFLAGDALAEVVVQPLGEPGFQRGALAADRILQDAFQRRRQGVDRAARRSCR